MALHHIQVAVLSLYTTACIPSHANQFGENDALMCHLWSSYSMAGNHNVCPVNFRDLN